MKQRNPQLALRLDAAALDPLATWRDGLAIPYLGCELTLRLATGKEAVLRDGIDLHVTLPPEATPLQIRDACEAWLRGEAAAAIGAALARQAARLGRPAPPWRLSFAARSHWAGADRDGLLRFHWRLIEQPAAVIDQVVGRALAALLPAPAEADLFGACAA